MKTTKTDLSKKGSAAKKIKPTLPSESTKRKRAEKALEEERNLLRTLMDNLPDTIYFKDAESRFIRINQALAHRFGIDDPVQAVGKTDFDFFGGRTRPASLLRTSKPSMQSGDPLVGKDAKRDAA